MRIVRFQKADGTLLYGVLKSDNTVIPITGDIFEDWTFSREHVPLEMVSLVAPVEPPNVIGIGLNYRDHAAEAQKEVPEEPVIFIKASTAVIGSNAEIKLPSIAPTEVDYEAELAVVIGKRARKVEPVDATKYILGYTCANDVSARDLQLRRDKQWSRGKSLDTFAPIGPWIETDLNADSASIRARLNGEVVQHSNTCNLIFGIPHLISFLSQGMTLLPGTVILTGTPGGSGYARNPPRFLRPGDTIEVEVEGIGVLCNVVVAERTGN